jgi:catechol 2,3-dioxygenase-like lactoylglutathione lyase family enzyme
VVDQAAGRPCRTASCPYREGGNRFSVEVADLAGIVDRLRAAGVHVRTELITGVGGKQVVLDDPSGNPVELFEPTRAEARLISPSS